ncbi:hypothetical protein B0J14DRAFT_702443 [Halenospora varia]|nr:hypothetical protein B0J14DRAFT_702443 [Halenospora varia]
MKKKGADLEITMLIARDILHYRVEHKKLMVRQAAAEAWAEVKLLPLTVSLGILWQLMKHQEILRKLIQITVLVFAAVTIFILAIAIDRRRADIAS